MTGRTVHPENVRRVLRKAVLQETCDFIIQPDDFINKYNNINIDIVHEFKFLGYFLMCELNIKHR